ncbi:Dor1-like family-domain-containing protein [Phlebopus sp. FC_14]|nr:Dor1-like family-domain-containing protein [Phlebopus sp. FC_14]
MTTELVAGDGELTTLSDLLLSSSELFDDPDNEAYLAQLPSLALPELQATPTALSTQSHTLTSSLTALTHTSYPTFLSLHKTSTALFKSLSSLDASLDTLLDTALPALDNAARVFREKSGPSVIEERQRARVVLEQHDKLQDLLDVPVLIDTCIRNGLYAEALALATHASTTLSALCKKQLKEADGEGTSTRSSPLQLARSLQMEVTSSLHSMRLLLLNTLHEPARKLPAFWKAVQFLRRMQVMPENELALAFVGARIGCLQNALQAVERDADDIARFLKRYIDVWREGAYDLVTQYTTIFLERPQHSGSLSSVNGSSNSPLPDPVIKQTFPPTLLSLLLPTLQTYLRRAYPHLAPLSTQLAYCSSAMARVGMEFRALLSPLITDAVVDGFTRDIRIGADREWTTIISKYTSASKPVPPSNWLISSSHPLPPISSICIPSSNAVHAPPQILTSFPPLAHALNAHLRALNRLRMLTPVGALNGILDVLESALAKIGEGLLSYSKSCKGSDIKETEILGAAGAAYTRVLVPFLRRAVAEGVFGPPHNQRRRNDGSKESAQANGQNGVEDAGALGVVLRDWEGWLANEMT